MLTSRRELMALPGAAEFFAAWLRAADDHSHGPAAPPEPPLLRNYKPQVFDAADFAALQAFTQILIPTDDTPGAREAHCAHYIDFVLQASPETTRKQWLDALASLRAAGFHAGDPAAREALIAAMAAPERDRAATHPLYAVYRLIKQQNSLAFYTSRAGLIEALDYRGNSYNEAFPGCNHPEHHTV